MRFDMTDTDMPPIDSKLRGDAQTFPRQLPHRRSADRRYDFDIRPGNPPAPAGAENLQHRLLGRESPCQMLEIPPIAGSAILPFPRRKAAIKKMLAMLFDQRTDAGRFHNVDPMANNRHVRQYNGQHSPGAVSST